MAAAIFILGSRCLPASLSDWRFGPLPPLAAWQPLEGGDVTDGGAVPAVQLPPNVYQNYGEAEEDDDPYRYYQPNYPAPRPVEAGDPALNPETFELRSPGVHRSSRSLDGEEVQQQEEEEKRFGQKRRLKKRVQEAAGTN